ncbi:MAG TPA: homoserine kinase [Jiangellaceae bacterium]|nr:homoserine kinase [Jiangellaceae bacterium]
MKRGVQVRVPATSANLGPGFDTLGLALDWHDVVTARVVERTPTAEGMPTARAAGGRTTVEVSGEGAGVLPGDEHHLVARTMRETFDLLRVRADELELRCENSVPHGRGLGSSAAAIVAGVLAARALAAADTGQLPDDAVLALAARIEGHADNVAACLLGGLTIAWTSHQGPRAIRLEVHPELRAIACVPEAPLATAAARALLPAAVPHADAARNAAGAALLVEALTRRPEVLLDATHDLLHQQYRAPAMPDSLTLVAELRARGLAAVVSGAGPSVVVLSTGADDLASVVEVTGRGSWQVRQLEVDHRGAVVESM